MHMRDDPFISYSYLAGGRVVQAQCSSAALRIEDGIAEPLTPEDTAIYERYRDSVSPEKTVAPLALVGPEEAEPPEIQTIAEPLTEEPDPDVVTVAGTGEEVAPTTEVPSPDTDWPAGYTFKRSGAYVAVFDPDGDEVRSTTPSGMWRMEAGRKAAWHDLEA